MTKQESYILVTSAKNEADYIEKTLKSVVSQVKLPRMWIIINDGSTDNTDEIVKSYEKEHSFIKLISLPKNQQRDFASKVYALSKGFEIATSVGFDFIGILDADISFDENYYKNILLKFSQNPKLGIAGGIFYDLFDGVSVKVVPGLYSVRGAVQFFRKQCFLDVGGLEPLKNGGEDTIAEVSARMHGWETFSFKDLIVYHHRRTGTATFNIFRFRFSQGLEEYALGDDPLFEIFKSIKNVFQKPYIIGGILKISGYLWAKISNYNRVVSKDYIEFLKKEQRSRLKFWNS